MLFRSRGGDFALHIGQDVSIGYLSHSDSVVRLYLQETFTFLLLTAEAAVALAPRPRRKNTVGMSARVQIARERAGVSTDIECAEPQLAPFE